MDAHKSASEGRQKQNAPSSSLPPLPELISASSTPSIASRPVSSVPRQRLQEGPSSSSSSAPTQDEELVRDVPMLSLWRRLIGSGLPLPYPGKFDDLAKESRGILEPRDNFDGFMLDVSRAVTPNFDLTHAISFGSQTEPPAYNFVTRYFASSGISLEGRLTPGPLILNGSLQGVASLPLKIWYGTKGKPVSKLSMRLMGLIPKPSAKAVPPQFNMELNLKGIDYHGILKWHNVGMCELSYAQSVHPNLAMGLHGSFDSRIGKADLMMTTRLAWNGRKNIATLSLASFGQLSASYTQLMEQGRKTWSTEMQIAHVESHGVWEAIYSAGYAYNLLQSRVRARLDSNWSCSAILEEKVLETVTLLICGDLNYAKDLYKVGFGFSFHL